MCVSIIKNIRSDEILSKIAENFDNKIYLVGGTVRDYFFNKKSHDRDIVVMDEDAREFACKLKKLFKASFVPLDEENKIYRLVLPDKINYIDVTNPVGNSITNDLQRRDLTINAIAADLKTGDVVDPFGGIKDIRNKTINYILERNFDDDTLRVLRVFRFQALYWFELTPDTFNVVSRYAKYANEPASERIIYELQKIFGGKYAHTALENMDKTGVLEVIFPFVKELKKVPPNSHHHLDLFHHSLETVRQIQFLYEQAYDEVKEHLDSVDFGGFPRLTYLKLAGFMHDIGKFSVWTIENGRHRFIKHDDVGANLAAKLLKNMNFSNKVTEYVSTMVKYHIYPSHVVSATDVSEKTMMRFVRKSDKNAIDNIILAMADRLSARGPEITDEIVKNNIDSLKKLLDFYLEKRETLEPLPKLLDGKDVMKLLNIKPSPKLGEILDALYEAQLSGNVTTKEQAQEFVKNMGNHL